MAGIILPPGWRLPERDATPESIYFDRRAFLKKMGLSAAALSLSACSSPGPLDINDVLGPPPTCDDDPPAGPLNTICPSPNQSLYPASPGTAPPVPYGEPTAREIAAIHSNFYEFIGSSMGMPIMSATSTTRSCSPTSADLHPPNRVKYPSTTSLPAGRLRPFRGSRRLVSVQVVDVARVPMVGGERDPPLAGRLDPLGRQGGP